MIFAEELNVGKQTFSKPVFLKYCMSLLKKRRKGRNHGITLKVQGLFYVFMAPHIPSTLESSFQENVCFSDSP